MRGLLRRRRRKGRSEQGRGAGLGGPLDRLLHFSFQYLAYGTLDGVAGIGHISRAWRVWTCLIRRLGSVISYALDGVWNTLHRCGKGKNVP
jgi:hypothetical protein